MTTFHRIRETKRKEEVESDTTNKKQKRKEGEEGEGHGRVLGGTMRQARRKHGDWPDPADGPSHLKRGKEGGSEKDVSLSQGAHQGRDVPTRMFLFALLTVGVDEGAFLIH